MTELHNLTNKVGEIDQKMNKIVDFIQGSFGAPGFVDRHEKLDDRVQEIEKEQTRSTKLLGYVSLLSGAAGALLKSLLDVILKDDD